MEVVEDRFCDDECWVWDPTGKEECNSTLNFVLSFGALGSPLCHPVKFSIAVLNLFQSGVRM